MTDLEDQRDKAITDLSKLIDITYYQRGDGDVVVFTQNGSTLVDRTAKTVTHTAVSTLNASSSYAEGDINGIFVGLLPLSFAGVGTRDAALIFFYSSYFDAEFGAALGLLCTLRYVIPGVAGLPFLRSVTERLDAYPSTRATREL